jgi:hypothetical protein
VPITQFRIAQQNQIFWHRLIRLEQNGLGIEQMSKILGCSRQKIERHLKYPAYIEFRESRYHKRISAFDRELAKDTERQVESLRELIPLTIQMYEHAMRQGMQDNRYLMAGVKAADSVNDRIGIFARQSTQIHEFKVPQADLDRARNIAKQLKAKAIDVIEVQATEDQQQIDANSVETPQAIEQSIDSMQQPSESSEELHIVSQDDVSPLDTTNQS